MRLSGSELAQAYQVSANTITAWVRSARGSPQEGPASDPCLTGRLSPRGWRCTRTGQAIPIQTSGSTLRFNGRGRFCQRGRKGKPTMADIGSVIVNIGPGRLLSESCNPSGGYSVPVFRCRACHATKPARPKPNSHRVEGSGTDWIAKLSIANVLLL